MHERLAVLLTDSYPPSDGLPDVEERTKGVEELQHHDCIAKLFRRYEALHRQRLGEGLEREGERERERGREGGRMRGR